VIPALAAGGLPPVFEQWWFFFGYLFVDALLFPLASTVYVAYMGERHVPGLVAVVGALGTTLGSLGQYFVVRWIVTRPSGLPGWLVRWRAKLETAVQGSSHATFWTLFVIYATPLGAGPLRLVAAVGAFPPWKFALAIAAGCLPYYFAVALVGRAIKLPAWVYAALVIALVALALAQYLARRAQARHKPGGGNVQ
jgi:membrane protein YqaA with SNARE-associated domain